MSTPIRINPGIPPLLWSTVQEAFDNINQNFTTVYASIEGGGITPVDFGNLLTNVSPSVNATYDLGNSLKNWRDIYINRDLHIGDAVVTSVGSAVNLPSGSTIGGSLLDQEYFRNIEVAGQPTLVADAGGNATLTINPSTGIAITTNATTDTINFTNTGIISASAGAGIIVSGTNPLQITNTGVTRLEAGNGMIVDVNTGTVTITNGSPASTLRCFEYINLGPGGIVRADNNFDTVNITGDEHILINKIGSAASNNIEFTFNNRVDIIGSVFGEDSSVLVDATSGTVVGPISTSSLRTSETNIALGAQAGQTNQGASTIAIGGLAGSTNQGTSAVAIGGLAGSTNQGVSTVAVGALSGNSGQGATAVAVGALAGNTNQGAGAIAVGSIAGSADQGANAIAIGALAGSANQPANSIVLNASGAGLNGSAAGLYINPIRNITGSTFLNYNPSTKEIGYDSDLRSEGNINIEINLSDSTTYRWQFGEDGRLTLPRDIVLDTGGISGPAFGITVPNSVTGTPESFYFDAEQLGTGAIFFPDGTYQRTAWNNRGDLIGSVFSDDSTMIVDGTSGNVSANTITASTAVVFPRYADTTARDAALVVPQIGSVIFLDSTSKLQVNIDGTTGGWQDLN